MTNEDKKSMIRIVALENLTPESLNIRVKREDLVLQNSQEENQTKEWRKETSLMKIVKMKFKREESNSREAEIKNL